MCGLLRVTDLRSVQANEGTSFITIQSVTRVSLEMSKLLLYLSVCTREDVVCVSRFQLCFLLLGRLVDQETLNEEMQMGIKMCLSVC